MTKLNPYLNFAGNAEDAFTFYKSVFGGEFTALVRFKEMPVEGLEITEADGNKVMHVSLPIGDNVLMASDVLELTGQPMIAGNNSNVSVHPDSKQEADRIFNTLSAGGQVEVPIADQPWGDYYGNFVDKFGVRWMVNYHEE